MAKSGLYDDLKDEPKGSGLFDDLKAKKPLYDAEFAKRGPKRGKDQEEAAAKAPTRPTPKERRSQAKEDVSSLRAPYRKATVEAKPGEILRATLKNPSKPPTTAAGKQAQQAAAKRNKPLKQEQRNVGISTGKEIREGAAAMEDAMFNTVARGFVPKGTPDDKVKDAAWKERPDLSLLTSIVTGTVAMPPRILGNVVKFLEGDEPGKAAFETALDTLPLIGKGIGAGARAAERGVLGAVEKAGAQGANVGPVMGATREVVGNVLLKRQGAIKGAVRAGAAATKEVAEKGQPVAQRVQETKVQKPGGNAPLANATRRAVTPEPNVLPVNENAFWEDFYGVNSIPETPQTPKLRFVEPDKPLLRRASSNAAGRDSRAAVGIQPAEKAPFIPTVQETQVAAQTFDPVRVMDEARLVLQTVREGKRPAPRSAIQEDQAGMALVGIEDEYNTVTAQIAKAIDDGQDPAALYQTQARLRQDLDDLTQANDYVGTEWSRAGRARNRAYTQQYTPAGLYNEAQSAAGRKLTQAEREAVEKIGIQDVELTQKIRDLEAKNAELLAQANLRTGRSRGSRASGQAIEQIRVRRSAAVDRLKTKMVSSNLSANLDPTKLWEISGDVIEIAKTYADEGIVRLGDVVSRMRTDFADAGVAIEDGDIHRILAGEYDRPTRPTMSEAQRRLSELRKAAKDTEAARNARARRLAPGRAKRAGDAADVRKTRRQMAEEAKAERQRIAAAREQGRKEAAAARKDYENFWKDELAEYEAWWKTSIPGQREAIEKQIGRLEEIVRTGDVAAPKPKAKPPKEVEDLLIKREALRVEADEIRNALKVEREARERPLMAGLAKDAIDFQRGLVASSDFSAPLNQGAFFAASRPITSAKAFKAMAQASRSPEKLREIQAAVRLNPQFERARAAGLQLAVAGPDASSEMVVGRILGKIPGVAISERAYTAYLTKLRMDTFANIVETMERPWMGRFGAKKLGIDEYKQIAEYVNTATGVGTGPVAAGLKSINRNLPVFFAPGYMVSRWKLALGSPAINAAVRRNPKLAAIILKDYVKFATAAGGSLYLLDKAGYEADLDIRSSKFGKLKVGETWVDPFGGIATPLRVAAQVGGGAKRGNTYAKPNDAMTAGYYALGRASPVLRTGLALKNGEAFGKKYDLNTPEGLKNVALSFAPIQVGQQFDMGEDRALTAEQKAVLRIIAIFGANVNAPNPNYRQ